MGCSHSPYITCPLGWGGVKMLDLKILPDFNFVAAGGIRVSQTRLVFAYLAPAFAQSFCILHVAM